MNVQKYIKNPYKRPLISNNICTKINKLNNNYIYFLFFISLQKIFEKQFL